MARTPTLIETVRVRDGRAPLWYLHLRRLSESCVALGVPFPPALEVPGGGADRVHRLEVGWQRLEVTTRDVGSLAPVRLVTARTPHRPYPHKTTDRGQFDAARAEGARAGADDALLLTPDGTVAECAIWSLLWWEGERVAGPPLALGVLRSVSRMRCAELAGELVERQLRREELRGRSLFVANAVRGVVPVAELDGEPVPADPRTGALAGRFWS